MRITPASARNRLRGVVTRVRRDGVMAQVDLQCGPFRLVSLMTREAADELGLEPGVLRRRVREGDQRRRRTADAVIGCLELPTSLGTLT